MNPLFTTFTAAAARGAGLTSGSVVAGPPPTYASGQSITVDFFLVGGGGGGGDLGGGGGGGNLYKSSVTVKAGDTHTITVGSAGTALLVVGGPAFPYRGGAGGNTAISLSTSPGGFTQTGITGNIALGGGGGGKYEINASGQAATKFAGCGGGISQTADQGGGVNETGVGLQGFNGGYGTENSQDNRAGGGGGGGGANGANCRHNPYASGDGGAGTTSSVSTWTPVQQGFVGVQGGYFAGGAGGGCDDFGGSLGAGGIGGGGAGGGGGPNTPPGNGVANTGGGGGAIGVRRVQQYSGSGGTGVCIIRTSGSYFPRSVTGSPNRREGGGYTYYTWTGDGSITL
jgi:hypothetical protein